MAKRDPERTRERILAAAVAEFADKGLGGARVDAIAERARANKRMIYHYFGNKEDLFVAVLEHAYESIRGHETGLDLQVRAPVQGILDLVRFTFRYFQDHPEFIRILNNENLHDARHVRRSDRIPDLQSPLVDQLTLLLRRGEDQGDFRPGVEPVQLYISIAALGYFYLSNAATLGATFKRDLKTADALDARLDHITDMVLGFLRP